MKDTTNKRIDKILAALEKLSEQHEMLIQEGNLEQASEVRERLSAVLADLPAMLEHTPPTPAQIKRAEAIQESQQRCINLLQERARGIRDSLSELGKSRVRISTLRRAYGKSPYAPRKVSGGPGLDLRG